MNWRTFRTNDLRARRHQRYKAAEWVAFFRNAEMPEPIWVWDCGSDLDLATFDWPPRSESHA